MDTNIKEESPGVYNMGDRVYVLTGGDGAIVEFEDTKPFGDEISEIRTASHDGESLQYAAWGKDNNLPAVRERLIMENHLVPGLIEAKTDIILGQGLALYDVRYENGKRIVDECEMTNEMKDFIEAEKVEEKLLLAAKDLVIQAQYFPEYVRNLGGKIVSMEVIEATYVRAEKIEKSYRNNIKNWLICGDWSKFRGKELEKVSAYQNGMMGRGKYIRRYGNPFFGGPYYYSPGYWGGRVMMKLSNCIPIFHLSSLNNGYTIRFHVRVPHDYFFNIVATKPMSALTNEERKTVLADAKAEELKFKKQLNDLLKGAKNAGRAIFTPYDVSKMVGKEYPGIQIETINFDMKDESLLKLFDKANESSIAGQGILPSISGIETGGKLSSGSDIRNAYAFFLAARTYRPRRQLFGCVDHLGRTNGWFAGKNKNCQFGARDMIITTTDKNPDGMEQKPN